MGEVGGVGMTTCDRARRKTQGGWARELQVENPERGSVQDQKQALTLSPFLKTPSVRDAETRGPEKEGDLLSFLPSS